MAAISAANVLLLFQHSLADPLPLAVQQVMIFLFLS